MIKKQNMLVDWSLKDHISNKFVLPEYVLSTDAYLAGKVFNSTKHNPKTTEFADDHNITTSMVVSVNYDTFQVTTQSGTLYNLATINEEYTAFCRDNGSVMIESLLKALAKANT